MDTRRSKRGSEDEEILLFLQPCFGWKLSSINIETLEITITNPQGEEDFKVLANRSAYLWLSFRRHNRLRAYH